MVYRRSEPLRAYRIANASHPIFDGTGAFLHGARWNSPGRRVIYAAETYAGALLEVLVHASIGIPNGHRYIEIEIPAGIEIEIADPAAIPGWDERGFGPARDFGNRWYDEKRTAVLLVPSVVTAVERNILINQQHPDFERLQAGEPAPVLWDNRLWKER